MRNNATLNGLMMAASLYAQMQAEFRSGNLRSAESLCEDGLSRYPAEECLEWNWWFRIGKSEALRQQGYIQQAWEWLAHDPPEHLGSVELRATYLMCRGYLCCAQANYAECKQLLDQASSMGVESLSGEISLRRGTLFFRLRDLNGAAASFQAALDTATRSNDTYLEGLALGGLGKIRREMGSTKMAIVDLERAIAVSQAAGARFVTGAALTELAYTHYLLKDYEQAFDLYTQSARLLGEIGARLHFQVALGDLGNIYLRRDDYVKAADHYRQALAISRELDDPFFIAKWLRNLEHVAFKTSDPIAAARYRAEWESIDRRLAAAREAAK